VGFAPPLRYGTALAGLGTAALGFATGQGCERRRWDLLPSPERSEGNPRMRVLQDLTKAIRTLVRLGPDSA
jgi:hypothetical protein